MAGKYQPLTDRLAALAELDHQSVDMDFADIAALVAGLPPSAYRNRQWWANSSLTQAAAWRAADWHVDHVDFERERVRFARGKVGGIRTTETRRAARPAPPSGDALAVELTDPEVDVRVRMTWNRAGTVIAEQGRLVFPALPKASGIYRLTFSGLSEHTRIYIGESDNLRRRAGHYRNPGPTQQTSQRIHDELLAHIAAGGTVTMSVATSVEIETDERSAALPLARKTARVLTEHAALGLGYVNGTTTIINRDRGAE
jgi:hypothetical protein